MIKKAVMKIYLIGSTHSEIARALTDKHIFTLTKQYGDALSLFQREKSQVEDKLFQKYKDKNCVYNWVSKSKQNYIWLYELFVAIAIEYKLRYNKDHMSYVNLCHTLAKPPSLPDIGITQYETQIPHKYFLDDQLNTHRNYYANEKIKFATWRPPAVIPNWIIEFRR